MVAQDAVICMRVQSGKEHVFANHAVGWYHWLKDPLPSFHVEQRRERPEIRTRDILTDWSGKLTGPSLESLAKKLGVSYSSLRLLECTWAEPYKAWAFPMRGGDGEYNGIRLRAESGKKWAVTGSKEGVFYVFGFPNTSTLYVVEGPTDTAAAMTIGLDCVGRPSCYGGVEEIRIIVRNQKYSRVVIVSDSDDVGRRGALTLRDALPFVRRCILTLPCKDMRAFVQMEGTQKLLDSMVSSLIWIQPTKGNQ